MTQLKSMPLDGGRPLEELSTRELVQVMVKVQRSRHSAVADLEALTASLARAKKEATEVHARAFLRHDGPQEERTQTAKQAAAGAVFQMDVEKGKLDACKVHLDILKDDWDTCRSANSNERAERSATDGWGS